MEKIIEVLNQNDFKIINNPEDRLTEKEKILKGYIQRLTAGEELEVIRNEDGTYLGAMEAVQEMGRIKDALVNGIRGPI